MPDGNRSSRLMFTRLEEKSMSSLPLVSGRMIVDGQARHYWRDADNVEAGARGDKELQGVWGRGQEARSWVGAGHRGLK